MKKILAATIGLSFAISGFANPTGEHLIQTVSKGQLVVTKSFSTPFGLTGYVAHPKGSQQGMVMYTDTSGKYLMVGNVVDAQGVNYTQKYTEQYVTNPTAAVAYKQLETAHWFTDGNDNAPHKMYVLIDPNCIYCHLLFKELRPLIDAGKLQVRWVPVGFLKPTSLGKAAALLHAGSDTDSVTLLKQDEANFDQQQEEGGIAPLQQGQGGMSVNLAFSRIQSNNAFFKRYLQGTPAIFYKDDKGQVHLIPSYIDQKQLDKVLPQVGKSW
jgi:thiol:disulfide interchange protein DsbG